MPTTNTNTIRLHRVLRATPERIYRAFLVQAWDQVDPAIPKYELYPPSPKE